MKDRCKRHAKALAIVFASVAVVLIVVLIVVVWVQAVLLYSRGSRLVMGDLPEWVSAGCTAILAFGVVAAFLTLRIVRREWESQQAEQRDQLAKQARLIVVEDVPLAEQVPPANTDGRLPDGKPVHRYVVIRNHSQEPIYNVRIPGESPKRTRTNQVVSVSEVRSEEETSGSYKLDRPSVHHRSPPELVPVLAPGQVTHQLDLPAVPRDEQVTEYVFFTFTDARGADWQRLGSEQPKPLV